MTGVLFSPYGEVCEESKLLYLIAAYLGGREGGIMQLLCNGTFQVCGRDLIKGLESEPKTFERSLSQCAQCISEGRLFANLAKVDSYSLSRFISGEDVHISRFFVAGLERDNLLTARYEGMELYNKVVESFTKRFARKEPNLMSRAHETYIRQGYTAAIRMKLATLRFLRTVQVSNFLVVDSGDFLSLSLIHVLKESKVRFGLLRWNSVAKRTEVERIAYHAGPKHNLIRSRCSGVDYMIDALTLLHSNPKSWSNDRRAIIERTISELGLWQTQNLNL